MKIIVICGAIAIFLFLLFVFPMNIKLKFHIDAVKGKMFYSIKILGIKILIGTIFYHDGKIVVQNTNNLILMGDKEVRKKESLFIFQVIKQITISRLELYFDGGLESQPFVSSLVSGYIYSLFCGISAYIITRHPLSHINIKVNPTFNSTMLELSALSLLEISLLDIVVAKIKSQKQYKELKNGKE